MILLTPLTFGKTITNLQQKFIRSSGVRMRKLFLLIGLIFFSSYTFPQYYTEFPVKQITFFNHDVKNPKFFNNSYYSQNELLFESYVNSTINIGLLSYDAEKDTFFNLIKLTDNSGQNLNPLGIRLNNGVKIVFYQTNIKGTWDIAYREFKDNQWGTSNILVDSSGDETNPSFILDFNGYDNSIKIFFEKDSSIFMLTKKDSLIRADTIFAKNESLKYSQPTGYKVLVYDNKKWKEEINCVSKQTDKQNKSRLVLSTFWDMQKISEKVLIDSGEVNNPKLQLEDNYSYTFENKLTGFSNIYFMDPWYLNYSGVQRLIDEPSGDLSSFSSSFTPLVITKTNMGKTVNKRIFSPYTFILKRNDSTFVRIRNNKNYSFPDSMIYTKITNNKPMVASVGLIPNWQVFYYVWEDSIDGRINFVGRKELLPFGAVEPEAVIKDFQLYQNYPNPFNPVTVIRYDIPSASFVTLKVYDVLGREVARLVNEEKQPGRYQVLFNASRFSSGIYFYRMKAGSFVKTNKLILLK